MIDRRRLLCTLTWCQKNSESQGRMARMLYFPAPHFTVPTVLAYAYVTGCCSHRRMRLISNCWLLGIQCHIKTPPSQVAGGITQMAAVGRKAAERVSNEATPDRDGESVIRFVLLFSVNDSFCSSCSASVILFILGINRISKIDFKCCTKNYCPSVRIV
jgi:hypothetical protein